jgi:putative phosphoserine phosphatase/1-acylglycerol-3-phosphate O-acyltransferase
MSDLLTVDDAIKAVLTGPSGPHIGAFFDLDGTLVEGYTANTFFTDSIRRRDIAPGDVARSLLSAVDGALGGDPTAIGRHGVAAMAGRDADTVLELGERLFAQRIAASVRPQARELVRAHQRRKHTVCVASAATRFQIEPLARDLGISNVLCTEVDVVDGVITGELAGPMLWGEPKGAAVRAFAREHGIDLSISYAYGNGDEDVPFLASVGKPHPLNPHPGLAVAARSYGWPVLTLQEPRNGGLRALAGTAAALGGFNVGMMVGAAAGLISGDARVGRNIGVPLACDLALALAGVQLEIVGEQNLWAARPAVFVSNHQSSLDAPLMGALLRRNFTGVAKKEARFDPRMAVAGLFVDPAYIDRSHPDSAKRDLAALADRIRAGTSVVIMPEGTRSPTPNVLPFKKGAFHLAMQAGVPIVPIVVRNAGELMWRSSKLLHSGTLQIAVLAPIPTDGWTPESIDGHSRDLRDRYLATLADWPEAIS